MLAIFSYTNPLKCCNVQLRFMSVVNSWGGEGDLMGDNGILAEMLENLHILHSLFLRSKILNLTAVKM